MINDASNKLRNAADVLTLKTAKSIYNYIEGDVLRHLSNEHRKLLLPVLAAIRAEVSPGAPSWMPDVELTKKLLNEVADAISHVEMVSMGRAKHNALIEAAREEGRQEGRATALDASAEALETRLASEFIKGLQQGRAEGLAMAEAERLDKTTSDMDVTASPEPSTRRNRKQQEATNGANR